MPPSRTIFFALFSFTLCPFDFYAASLDAAAVSGEFEPAKRPAVEFGGRISGRWPDRFQFRGILLRIVLRPVTDCGRVRILPAVARIVRDTVEHEKMKQGRLDAAAREFDHVTMTDPGCELPRVF